MPKKRRIYVRKSVEPRPPSGRIVRVPQLPSEIIDMILDYLHDDPLALKICTVSARSFLPAGRYHLFRHITLNSYRRLVSCLDMLEGRTSDVVVQYVESIDIGFHPDGNPDYWVMIADICLRFGNTGKIKCLWLSDIPFLNLPDQFKEDLFKGLSPLFQTVTELGVYNCALERSLSDLMSLVGAFHRCKYLFIQLCPGGAGTRRIFSTLPKHTITLTELEISDRVYNPMSTSPISTEVFFHSLNMEKLQWLSCHLSNATAVQRLLERLNQPLEHLQVSTLDNQDFDPGLAVPITTMANLSSLTIGPIRCGPYYRIDILRGFEIFNCIENVSILLDLCANHMFDLEPLDAMIPDTPTSYRLTKLNLQITINGQSLSKTRRKTVARKLPKLLAKKVLYFENQRFSRT